ncbi:rhodanese-like domain-containing protein [Streptococcus agalactiae]|nr:rhodanese-like domain-containing protein [Streptococcus agalactiae]
MDMSVILIIVILLAFVAWASWNYWRVRRAAKFLDNESFQKEMSRGQLIDIREAGAFHRKHILGARNIPASQFKVALSALRKDKPVLLYDAKAVVSLFQGLFCYSEKKVLINFTC